MLKTKEKKMQIQSQKNNFWTNLHKTIKSKDIIRFLIGQFDLIMGQIKSLIMFKINLDLIKGLN